MKLRHYLAILRHPRIYVRGRADAHSALGITYCGSPDHPKSVAYDMGRNHGERVVTSDNNL